MKLSTSQTEVLQQLALNDEPLVYFKGGYWTLPSLGRFIVPGQTHKTWSTSMGTVKSLEKKGLVKQTQSATNYSIRDYPLLADRVLTPEGLALITNSETPMAGLVDLVIRWTGVHHLVYTSFNVLGPAAWEELLQDQVKMIPAHLDYHEFLENTAALTTDHGHIYVQAGHDSDALHELLHAAGIAPGNYETPFIAEGLTQAAAEAIAASNHLRICRSYEAEVEFVKRYLVPLTGMPLRQLVTAYIRDGLSALAYAIVERYENLFHDWREKTSELIYNGLRNTSENHIPDQLLYLIEKLNL